MIALDPRAEVLVVDGDGVALQGSQLLRLGAVPCAIVDFLFEPRNLDAVVDEMSALFGPPPEGSIRDAVVAQLVELRAYGLVVDDGELPAR